MRDFLSALWSPPHGYGELRFIKEGTVHQQYVSLSDPNAYADAARLAADYNEWGFDCYMGVLRRRREAGTAADCVDHTPVLWADIDPYKSGTSGMGRQQSREFTNDYCLPNVLNFSISPSIIVDSGHGIHAYWLLRQAVPVADATLAMKGIAKDIGGDNVSDPARILRLPGTTNHKHGDSVPVRLLRLDTTRRYRFSDFSDWYEKAAAPLSGTPHTWHTPSGVPVVPMTGLPDWLADSLQNGVPRGTRSEACFSAVRYLVRHGWTNEEIGDLFASHISGLGERYAEKPYKLTVDLRKARSE